MLLKKFVSNIKKQDWLSAFVEFCIVVLGIFTGLQADDWNTNRKKRISETIYLERLMTDVRASAQELKFTTSNFQTQVSSLEALADTLENKLETDFDQKIINQGVFSILSLASMRMNNGTFKELISAGKLDLLMDEELKILLLDQDALHDFVQTQHRDFRMILQNMSGVYDNQVYFHNNTKYIMPSLDYSISALSQDRAFKAMVQKSLAVHKAFLRYRLTEASLNNNIKDRLVCNLNKTICPTIDSSYRKNLLEYSTDS